MGVDAHLHPAPHSPAPPLQEAEHAAANAAVQFLQSEGLLTPSQTAGTGGGGGSSILAQVVGSKRSKEAADDEPGAPPQLPAGGACCRTTHPAPRCRRWSMQRPDPRRALRPCVPPRRGT